MSSRWRVVAAGVGLAALLAGCAGEEQSGSPAHRVDVWVGGTSMGSTVGTLIGDAARIETAVAEHKDAGVFHTDCGVITTDAESANSDLPTPDTELTDLLSEAYGLEGAAGNDCYNAGSSDPKLQARSARERARARGLLEAALARVRAVTGRSVSTTTTTSPGGASEF